MRQIKIGNTTETVIERSDYPPERVRAILGKETVAVLGYGVQGPAQSLNMKDNGINVIIGQAKEFKLDWDRAVKDGWVPGKTLFPIEEAAQRGTIIQYLVSDAGQKILWPKVKAAPERRATRCISRTASPSSTRTRPASIPPEGRRRDHGCAEGFGHERAPSTSWPAAGINGSFAVYQDATGRARGTLPGPAASPSAPAISSRPPSSKKSTAT